MFVQLSIAIKENYILNKIMKKYRNLLGLSQTEFARFYHVTQATVARWECENATFSIPNDAVEILHKIIGISNNDRFKQAFVRVLRGSDGFEICNAIINMIEADFTDESLASCQIRIKKNAIDTVNAFAREVTMKDIPSNGFDEFRTQDNINKTFRLKTHGFKGILFDFSYDDTTKILTMKTKHNRTDNFSLDLISKTLLSLYERFGDDEFPLANNVQLLSNRTERDGLGSTIYKLNGHDTKNAQAASYLGPLLEALGVLQWNGIHRGIKWKFCNNNLSLEGLEFQIKKFLTMEESEQGK